jgi:hypothetical protein
MITKDYKSQYTTTIPKYKTENRESTEGLADSSSRRRKPRKHGENHHASTLPGRLEQHTIFAYNAPST